VPSLARWPRRLRSFSRPRSFPISFNGALALWLGRERCHRKSGGKGKGSGGLISVRGQVKAEFPVSSEQSIFLHALSSMTKENIAFDGACAMAMMFTFLASWPERCGRRTPGVQRMFSPTTATNRMWDSTVDMFTF